MAGRPREFDRDTALLKARDTFWARGYEAVSISDLVEVLGIASARIYAAFGSKEALFREAIVAYDRGEGGFATRALAEAPTARDALERMLREAIELYTCPGHPRGCMVVSAATNIAAENDGVQRWLATLRRARTAALVARLERAVAAGELPPSHDTQALGDAFATILHGLSVQARDGVPKERLLAVVPAAMRLLDVPASPTRAAATKHHRRSGN